MAKQAIAYPGFTSAYYSLSSMYINAGDMKNARDAIQKAYDLRSSSNLLLQFTIASRYQQSVTRDLYGAETSDAGWTELYPRQSLSWNALDMVRDSAGAIVGMYNSLLGYHAGEEPLGATRFNADGTIEAANGTSGTWKLFDRESATYIIVIAGQRVSLHLDPGRGLIDANGNVTFTRTHS